MQKQIYPIGQQNFEDIRTSGKVYIDKTRFIPLLLENKFYFLSRPRRFGKSLLLSTLEAFFKGKRDLFSGLNIDRFDWDWAEYPVIRIDFSNGSFSKPEGLEERLHELLNEIDRKFSLPPQKGTTRARFNSIIRQLREKFGRQVVVLIDEYEKPLLDTLDLDFNGKYSGELSDFYSVLKDNDENIKFLFMTGVTRFGHLNIFSGLNNLLDISLDDEFACICGVTEQELSDNLRPGIEGLAHKKDIAEEEALRLLKQYYDGYHFSGAMIDIYNPFSLLSCLKVSRLTSKWFQSGSPSYLIKQLRSNRSELSDLEGVVVSEDELLGVDSSLQDIVTLMYQSGYLTIKDYNPQTELYTLGLPNFEVSTALYRAIIPYYLGSKYKNSEAKASTFIEMLEKGAAQEAMEWLQGYFSSIPSDVKLDYEAEFQQVIYAFFALAGKLAQTTLEKQTSDGRLDMVFYTSRFVYVFEFKRGEDAMKALNQINDKKYALQWQADERKVIKIGVAFSPKSRGIASFAIET